MIQNKERKNRSDDKEGTINPCREICWDSVSNGRDGALGKFVNGEKAKVQIQKAKPEKETESEMLHCLVYPAVIS